MLASVSIAAEISAIHQPNVRGIAREVYLDNFAALLISKIVLNELHGAGPNIPKLRHSYRLGTGS